MTKRTQLGPRRLTQLRAFLQSIGKDEHTVTAADKIAYLASLIEERPRLSAQTISFIGYGLRSFGILTHEEREHQAFLVRAYTGRLHSPPNVRTRRPVPTMPLAMFIRVLDQFDSTTSRSHLSVMQARNRALLKVEWYSGLRPQEIISVRRDWVEASEDGLFLHVPGPHARQKRCIPIGRSKTPEICAVTELQSWLGIVPHRPDVYLFPNMDVRGVPHWDKPLVIAIFTNHLRRALRRIGAGQYTLTSIRRNYYKRCRDQLGEAPAFYLSGLSKPELLARQLRCEPHWPKLKSLFGNLELDHTNTPAGLEI